MHGNTLAYACHNYIIVYVGLHGTKLFLHLCILQVDSAWSSGNYEEAQRNANIAKILNIVGFVIGILAWIAAIVVIIVQVVAVASVTQTSRLTYGS